MRIINTAGRSRVAKRIERPSCLQRSGHVENGTKYPERERAMNTVIWKCEQYIAGKLHEKTIFESEQQAKDLARKLYDVRPDTILRIEPMPIQHVWN